MLARRSGFTLVEMVFVLMISGIVMGIGVRETPQLWDRRSVTSARDAVLATSYTARAEAMRSGRAVYVWIRPDAGVVRVGRSPSELLDSVLMSDYRVTMDGDDLTLCYTARGYAMPACSDVTTTEEISFRRGSQRRDMLVLPLGQMWREE